ncbi:hypothetical protein [Lentzea sp. CA-135723]|uniref:hypothetical protein n=1 Tax=Lentzea sp. CA-135723 TaxID=3239950 RepID=UPI003D90D795
MRTRLPGSPNPDRSLRSTVHVTVAVTVEPGRSPAVSIVTANALQLTPAAASAEVAVSWAAAAA